MAAKDIRREVVREVTEVLEALKEEEEVTFKELDKQVAGNIHKDSYRDFCLRKLKPDMWATFGPGVTLLLHS